MADRFPFKIEVCVENTDGLLAAERAGADRGELCASLLEGGLTPSLGMVEEALARAGIPFHAIVRPRGGDFLYSEVEFAAMRADVRRLKDMAVAGVVVGCLTAAGAIDEVRMAALVEDAGPLAVTCHRAFDMAADPIAAVEALVRAGVDRVLTSGRRPTAEAGLATIKAVVEAAADRLGVIACGDLTERNIARIRRETGAHEMHFAAQKAVPSGMTFRNPEVGMGGTDLAREYTNFVLDEDEARRVIGAVRGG